MRLSVSFIWKQSNELGHLLAEEEMFAVVVKCEEIRVFMFVLGKGKYTGKIANSLNVDGSIVSITHYLAEESNCDWHYHENPHISFVFQGGESETQNRKSEKQNLSDIFFYHGGERHRWISPQPVSKSANIEIGNDFLKKFGLNETGVGKAIIENFDTKFLLLKMQQEMLTDDIESFVAIQTLLLELVTSSKTSFKGTAPKWVYILSDLLNDKWSESVTLSELSLAADVHPVTISKYFRKYFACTLGEYLRKLKIDKSIPLIKNSEASLTEIAFHCGFADQSHFIRNFKQMTGFLPKEFRNI